MAAAGIEAIMHSPAITHASTLSIFLVRGIPHNRHSGHRSRGPKARSDSLVHTSRAPGLRTNPSSFARPDSRGRLSPHTPSASYGTAFSPPVPPIPYPSPIALRNFSRSSGLIFRHRPRQCRPPCRPGPPCPSPPKRIRHSNSNPKACQKPNARQPNSGGSNQFHKCITTSPPMKMKSGSPTIAAGMIHHFLLINPP